LKTTTFQTIQTAGNSTTSQEILIPSKAFVIAFTLCGAVTSSTGGELRVQFSLVGASLLNVSAVGIQTGPILSMIIEVPAAASGTAIQSETAVLHLNSIIGRDRIYLHSSVNGTANWLGTIVYRI